MTNQTPTPDDGLDHLDFPTELPLDIGLLGERVADLIANAPADVRERIAPHFLPGNASVRFVPGADVVEVYMGPEPIGTIHHAALIPPEPEHG